MQIPQEETSSADELCHDRLAAQEAFEHVTPEEAGQNPRKANGMMEWMEWALAMFNLVKRLA